MGKTEFDVYIYSYVVVLAFGILGNILVIISILQQTRVLKNSYYFVVLHLAICDLGVLISFFFNQINFQLVEEPLVNYSTKSCIFDGITFIFHDAGIGMMLIISALRYRTIVHPLKPAISRRKLKFVCGLVYIVGFVAGYGTFLPLCLMQGNNVRIVYSKVYSAYNISCTYCFPSIFMAAVYYKIGRALIKQNKHMKSVCPNPVRQSAPSSSFNILKFMQNRRTFFICICTVLSYGVGNIPISVVNVWYVAGEYDLLVKSVWLQYLGTVLGVACSNSINPLIYGILDKKLLKFWTFCRKTRRRPAVHVTS